MSTWVNAVVAWVSADFYLQGFLYYTSHQLYFTCIQIRANLLWHHKVACDHSKPLQQAFDLERCLVLRGDPCLPGSGGGGHNLLFLWWIRGSVKLWGDSAHQYSCVTAHAAISLSGSLYKMYCGIFNFPLLLAPQESVTPDKVEVPLGMISFIG